MDITGKTIAVTGKFNDIQRKDIEVALAGRGAKVAKSVTGKTEILIAGEKAGSKLAKANKMGIRVIHEAELLEILKQEATVEVVAPKPKAVKMPKGYEDARIPNFEGRVVYSTGKLGAFTRAQLKYLLEASGATVAKSPNSKTTDVISGDKWSQNLRHAIANNANVWSEGELLLAIEGRTSFPEDKDVPNGANLSKLPAVKEGTTRFNTPGGADGDLVLHWKKVAFKPHRRFIELHGIDYAGDHQYVGKFHYKGEELKPAALFADFYGAESFRRSMFWECGSDFDDETLLFDGKNGFNCTPLDLKRDRLHVNWETSSRNGVTFYRYEMRGPNHYFGDVCTDELNLWVMVDLEQGLYAVNAHGGPYIINPDNPYGN